MTAVAIRKKLVSYLQDAEAQKVKAIYALVKDDIEQKGRIDIKQYNRELAEAEAEFAKGDYISNTAMKKKIKQW
jgi:DNA-binding protein Fis